MLLRGWQHWKLPSRVAGVFSSIMAVVPLWLCFRNASWRALWHLPMCLCLEGLSPGDTTNRGFANIAGVAAYHLPGKLRLKISESLDIILSWSSVVLTLASAQSLPATGSGHWAVRCPTMLRIIKEIPVFWVKLTLEYGIYLFLWALKERFSPHLFIPSLPLSPPSSFPFWVSWNRLHM